MWGSHHRARYSPPPGVRWEEWEADRWDCSIKIDGSGYDFFKTRKARAFSHLPFIPVKEVLCEMDEIAVHLELPTRVLL